MATGRDGSNYNATSLIRRDFRQDHGSGPEEMNGRPKHRGSNWCKGKVGREHNWEYKVVREDTRKVWNEDRYVVEQTRRWVCTKCNKQSWGSPFHRGQSNHKHEYTETVIDESNLIIGWATMYEACKCGRLGKSIYIDE